VGQAQFTGHRLIDPGTIGAKNGILVHQGARHSGDVGCVALLSAACPLRSCTTSTEIRSHLATG
jgi:hypothetical protein